MTSWYDSLARPPLTPPSAIFGPVWTVLYVLIAVSIGLYIFSPGKRSAALVFSILGAHLVFNFAWTALFFGLKNPGLALVDILLLDGTLVYLIVAFYSVSRLAAALLLPYLLWVCFATYLNAGFFFLNR
ncbi:tryptophan-rich sensory protein [Myxococcota bacterium]|nr:tryptophan-rich sensory protein [Myxococcota bacterium]